MGYFFHFSSLYLAPYIKLYMSWPIQISCFHFKAVLALLKTVHSAQTHKIISFSWIVWSTLCVYLCLERIEQRLESLKQIIKPLLEKSLGKIDFRSPTSFNYFLHFLAAKFNIHESNHPLSIHFKSFIDSFLIRLCILNSSCIFFCFYLQN